MINYIKSKFKMLISWGLALFVSVFILNILIIPLYHFAPWIDLPCNATTGLFCPNSIIVYGLEGFSIRNVDKNGYVNPNERADKSDKVLIMGSSHSVGKEVPQGENYTDIIENESNINIYNLAMDGNYFVEIMQGFNAAIEQFPEAKSVVIEVDHVDYSIDELNNARTSREYNKDYTGGNVLKNLSLKTKLKLLVQDYLPLLRQIQRNLKSNDISNMSFESSEANDDKGEYSIALESVLSEKRHYFDGDIVIVYHPHIEFLDGGDIKIIKERHVSDFVKVCNKYNIKFIDLSDDFMNLYSNEHKVPYGFNNTAPLKGHLNKYGHSIVADRLLEYFSLSK